MAILSENRPAVNVPFNADELATVFNALKEEKHRLMESHVAPKNRQPPSEGRKEKITDLWLLQAKIGGKMKPKQDPGPVPSWTP